MHVCIIIPFCLCDCICTQEFENGNYQELQYEVEVLKSQMQFTQEQQVSTQDTAFVFQLCRILGNKL